MNAVAVAAPVMVGEGGVAVQDKLKSSIADKGLLPLPVVDVLFAILIQTGPLLLSKTEPKFTVTFVLPQVPTVVVNVVGDEVASEKLDGVVPKP